jgi:hypothetical protein
VIAANNGTPSWGIGQLSGFASDNPFEIPDFPSGGSIDIPCDFGICGLGFGPLGFEEGQGDSVTDDSSVTVAGNGVCYYVLVNPCGANNGQTPQQAATQYCQQHGQLSFNIPFTKFP